MLLVTANFVSVIMITVESSRADGRTILLNPACFNKSGKRSELTTVLLLTPFRQVGSREKMVV